MSTPDGMRADLEAAIAGAGGSLSAADRLCVACVELLHVDGAAVSLMHAGSTHGTIGSSGPLSRQLDELQFTFGEGPCIDAYAAGRPVLVADIGLASEQRWPGFTGAALDAGVRAVFALPATVAATKVGILDLFRTSPGPLTDGDLTGGLLAAELAAVPLLDLLGDDEADGGAEVADRGTDGWNQLLTLERVEVYQATGMLMGQLDVGPAEALARLRAHAFATGQTASQVAWAIVERRLTLDSDESRRGPGSGGRSRG